MFLLERRVGVRTYYCMLQAGDHNVTSILRNPRMRGYFEDGLRNAFPPCYEPAPGKIKELLKKIEDRPTISEA